jgi:hypothetical protein
MTRISTNKALVLAMQEKKGNILYIQGTPFAYDGTKYYLSEHGKQWGINE